ncbi:hypothetical protein ABB37_08895 [Leptomonas pyrrhocoris]|uniref:Uncharacterized protein n=1 Tax=Leptomonas pyrrhocoris TaxID=157538 RepID=A0A0M9FS20_LEPPY|nr:hypothetical protein ABB37_08895 [Leptomonas pyrrhocoris]KPA74895.1 hypothetical protein ABB37_08895 [Leptomonas pyrrhocoris]|eukprot:XP_015653334.1 hypothetical protein ABB37_08895 [Leptomonas pyrrhocoris]
MGGAEQHLVNSPLLEEGPVNVRIFRQATYGTEVPMICLLGMSSGRLALYDGSTNTAIMWSSCELPITRVEFVDPVVQQRMGELYQIMGTQEGRLQSLEQQQGLSANAITSALTSLQVSTTSALERHASAAASAATPSLAFSAGRDANLATQLQAVNYGWIWSGSWHSVSVRESLRWNFDWVGWNSRQVGIPRS